MLYFEKAVSLKFSKFDVKIRTLRMATKNNDHASNVHCHPHNHHYHGESPTLVGELMCHLPYAMFAVAIGISILSFLGYGALLGCIDQGPIRHGSMILFHSFHFMHIAFAATGTLITYFRFSKNVRHGLAVGVLTSFVFCTLSDAILPYIAGRLLGVHMHLHLCFMTELYNILPFLCAGLVNGFVMSRHEASQQGFFSGFSHFFHILISSLASIFYLVSQGCTDWYASIGMVFVLLVIAVVVPCTLSDIVIPMICAGTGKKDEKYQN